MAARMSSVSRRGMSMGNLHRATGRSPGPRTDGGTLTECIGASWPQVEGPLRSSLAARGVPLAEIDDLVQETAARALECEAAFEDAEHLRRWCFVVARRLIVDSHRRNQWSAPLEEAVASACSGAQRSLEQVEDRDVLRRVAESIPQMRLADQAALRQSLPDAPTATAADRNRANVARHRARGRLRLLVGPFAAIAGACASALRRPRGAATAVALPALVALSISAPQGAALEAPGLRTQQLVVAQPQDGGLLVQRSTPTGETSSSARPAPNVQPQRVAAVAPAEQPSAHEGNIAVRFDAPARTYVGVARSAAKQDDSLVCLDGDLIARCLDSPDRLAPVAALDAAGRQVLQVAGNRPRARALS